MKNSAWIAVQIFMIIEEVHGKTIHPFRTAKPHRSKNGSSSKIYIVQKLRKIFYKKTYYVVKTLIFCAGMVVMPPINAISVSLLWKYKSPRKNEHIYIR